MTRGRGWRWLFLLSLFGGCAFLDLCQVSHRKWRPFGCLRVRERGRLGGGGRAGSSQTQRLADYSGQAARMFDNMRAPAALLAGGIVPLGFFAAPKIEPTDSVAHKWVKRIHYLVASIGICCELIAVVWSTVAVNKLNEAASNPSLSLMELLQRDYELPWIGCNVNFILGLMAFASLLVSYSYVSFGAVSRPITCTVCAAECLMISIVNDGVVQGDGREGGVRFGCNLFSLIKRYGVLLVTHAAHGNRFTLLLAFLFVLLAVFYIFAMLSNAKQLRADTI